MRHVYREINGRYYVRIQCPKSFNPPFPIKSREIRLSLYTSLYQHAVELALAYWLAARDVFRSPDLESLGIRTLAGLKEHIRASVMTQLPQKYTSLIELTGSADTQSLQGAIKLLSAYNTEFFVLPASNMGGLVHKFQRPTERFPKGSYEPISTARGQTFPHMRVTSDCITDAITNNRDTMQPDWLYYEANGEKFCLMTDDNYKVSISQLFVSTDLPANVITAIRTLSETRVVTTSTGVAVRKSELLSKAIEAYCKYKEGAWVPKSRDEFAMHLRVFKELVTDKELLQLTSKDYQFYVTNLPRWPKNASKNELYKGKNARDIASMPDPEEMISIKTMQTYYTTVTGFIRWAADQDENAGMNTSILRMSPQSNQAESDGYVAFSDQELSTIFESESSLSFLQNAHPYQIWIPVLGLFFGCRLDELCSLRIEQFGTENDIPYIEIRKGKTKNAVRKVPIPQTLLDLGILLFWEYKKSLGEDRLFPECSYHPKHGYKKTASRWFGEFLDDLKITDKTKVYHSFRHNVSNVLNETDLKSWRISRFMGHAIPSGASESERSYFKQRKLEHLLPVVEAIKYPIDWSKYKTLTESTYK